MFITNDTVNQHGIKAPCVNGAVKCCAMLEKYEASVDCGLENDVFLKDGQSYTFLFRCMSLS